MKKPEEYLKKLYITDDGEPNSIHDSVENVTNVIKQAQLDAWNEAVKECAENAEVLDDDTTYYDRIVDKKSILKLLKE